MSSTCVLSPNNSFISCHSDSTKSTTMTSTDYYRSGNSQRTHPALRGWTETNPMDTYNPMANNEVMSGSITLLSSGHGPQRIRLSVIRTSVDHFALVYPDNRRKVQETLKPVGSINLRGVTCEETVLGNGITGIILRPKKCDTSSASLTFVCAENSVLPQWIDALSPLQSNSKRNIPKKCSLPSLEEEEE